MCIVCSVFNFECEFLRDLNWREKTATEKHGASGRYVKWALG